MLHVYIYSLSDVDLVWKYSDWVLEKDQTQGAQVLCFTENTTPV